MRSRTGAVHASSPWWFQPPRWFGALAVAGFYRTAYRVRGWGRLEGAGGPRLIVANHQHEAEGAALVADLTLASGSWRRPIFTVSSRRMWEPGFMAERVPWLASVVGSANFGPLFSGLGLQPIENETQHRSLGSIAYALEAFGDASIEEVFGPELARTLPPSMLWLRDLRDRRNAAAARRSVPVAAILPPYQHEFVRAMRRQLAGDVAHFEALLDDGATIFLTPEGFYTGDGRMQPLRGILGRLRGMAELYLAGVSYDPFGGRRLGLLYRIERERPGVPLEAQLQAIRPVTVSALLASWLDGRTGVFSGHEAIEGVRRAIAALPKQAFLDPEVAADPVTVVRAALRRLHDLGIAERLGDRWMLADARRHPEFPRTGDIIAYQRNFHDETLAGLTWAPAETVSAAL